MRNPARFAAGRLAKGLPGRCLNVPLTTLPDRWFELPPVQTMASWLWVVQDDDENARLSEAIALRFAGLCPYPVNVFVWARDSATLTPEEITENGEFTHKPLWRPSPSLSSAIDHIEASLRVACIPEPWSVADVGCGSGRDAAFLASRGCWRVTIVDQSPPLLAKASQLCAQYGGVEPSVIQCNLASLDALPEALVAGPGFHLVHVARFLHKPLLPLLSDWVAPGGWIVYMSFADGAQHVGKCTPKNPKHLVFPGELQEVFSEAAGFHAPFRDSIVPLEDLRPACDFVVQKRME